MFYTLYLESFKHVHIDGKPIYLKPYYYNERNQMLLCGLAMMISPWIFMLFNLKGLIVNTYDRMVYDQLKIKFVGKKRLFLGTMMGINFVSFIFIIILGLLMVSLNQKKNIIIFSLLAVFYIILNVTIFIFIVFRWLVAHSILNDVHIKFNSDFSVSYGYLFLQSFLSAITLGVYVPFAIKKVYKGVLDNIIVDRQISGDKYISYEVDYDSLKNENRQFIIDILLTVITFGAYGFVAYKHMFNYLMDATTVSTRGI